MKSQRRTAIFLFSILLQINKLRELAACGQLQNVLDSRITFGHDTHRWPWHAAIYHQINDTTPIYQCGGTLVSSKFVLTAAHCVSVVAEYVSISLGRLHLNASRNSAPFIKAAEILPHPHYDPENFANDIAVITLATDAIFNSYVQPICMWEPDKIHLSKVIGRFGTVVGWGLTENGETPDVLQESSLPVEQSFKCLQSNRDLFGRFLTDGNFCAGTRNGTSVCTGDSGGSMTFQEDGRFYIRGIVSVGASRLVAGSTNKFMCDSTQYALFTDVAKHLAWIKETIGCDTKVVRCYGHSTDYCIVTVKESDDKCKFIFDATSSVAIKDLNLLGDGSPTVPDLSDAADKFINLESLSLEFFKSVKKSTLSAFKNISALILTIYSIPFDMDIFADLTNLKLLSINDGNLTILPAGIFRSNEKIRKLKLLNTSFTGLQLDPDVFANLRNAEELLLRDNKINTLPANIFRNNEKVRELNLSFNRLKKLHEDLFSGLSNLELLALYNNRIEYIPLGLFRSNSKLLSVNLSNNKIKKIEIDLNTMPHLSLISLSSNNCIDEYFNFPRQSVSQANDIIRRNCTN